jgi:adenylosuccinate lyase
MTNEEMNKKMEFIVEHQAKFAAEIEIMREVQAANEKQIGGLSRAVVTVVGLIGDLTEAQKRTDKSMNRLSEAQAQTEESLKALINTVERHIGGNGGPYSHA